MYVFRLFDRNDPDRPIDARMLRDGRLSIGRDRTADWVLDDPDCEISRAHCEFLADPDGLFLRATGANGVFDAITDARFPDGAPISLAVPQAVTMGRFRMTVDHAPDAADDGRTMVLAAEPAPAPAAGDHLLPLPAGDGRLFDAFCAGAGLDVSGFAADDAAQLMERAGAMYRAMVSGLSALLAERDRMRAQISVERTRIGARENNPFKWAPSRRLATDLLRGGEGAFLHGGAAVTASFDDLARHQAALASAHAAAMRAAIDRLDPDRAEDDPAPARPSLFGRAKSGDRERLRERIAVARAALDRPGGGFDAAFVDAYHRASDGPADA